MFALKVKIHLNDMSNWQKYDISFLLSIVYMHHR